MIKLISITALGYGIIMGIVIILVIIYTVIKLRKQVHDKEQEEQKKNKMK